MRLYISGPMSGLVDNNRPAFQAATRRLRKAGHTVLDPTELDLDSVEEAATQDSALLWRLFLCRDVAVLLSSAIDAIVLLEGWRVSKGSRLEMLAGMCAGLAMVEEASGQLFPLIVRELSVEDLTQRGLDKWNKHVEARRV